MGHRSCGWREAEQVARWKGDFDEFLCVPGVNKTQINIHCTIDRSLVTAKEPARLMRMIQHFVQSIGALFTAEDSEKNAATKDWIDKSGSIACEQPAIAVQLPAAIGEIVRDVNFRSATPVPHSFGDYRLFATPLAPKLFWNQFRTPQHFAVEHDADAGAFGCQGDHPKPAIDSAN